MDAWVKEGRVATYPEVRSGLVSEDGGWMGGDRRAGGGAAQGGLGCSEVMLLPFVLETRPARVQVGTVRLCPGDPGV